MVGVKLEPAITSYGTPISACEKKWWLPTLPLLGEILGAKLERRIHCSNRTCACGTGQWQPGQALLCEMLGAKLEPTILHSTRTSACAKGQ